MAHALLSPSSASRWLTCTPSARLEATVPDTTSPAAAEGTLAHAIGEHFIRQGVQHKKYAISELLKSDALYAPEMEEYMMLYADYVLEQFHEAKSRTKDARIYLENKIDLTRWVPDGFGTGDVIIIADGVLDVIDLKYGKGVPVSAVENRQMMLYGLGALYEFGFIYDIHTVRMTIYQPRLDSISVFEKQASDLFAWGEGELKEKAALAFAGEGEFKPGDACRFCRVRATCRAHAEYNLELAKHEFKEPELLNDAEISDILTKASNFTTWIAAVQSHALSQAVNNGKAWPGYKLVEGRSVRSYLSEDAVVEKLHKHNYTDDQLYTMKLIGITAMEKLLTKKGFDELLKELVIKPAGKPTLVPENDKRPPINAAEAAAIEFDEFIDN